MFTVLRPEDTIRLVSNMLPTSTRTHKLNSKRGPVFQGGGVIREHLLQCVWFQFFSRKHKELKLGSVFKKALSFTLAMLRIIVTQHTRKNWE